MPQGFNHNAVTGVSGTPGPRAVRGFSGGEAPYFEMAFRIEGVSRDSTGAPLPGCQCILYRIISPVESRQEQDVVSDAEGKYSFNVQPPPAEYRVTFDLAGDPFGEPPTYDLMGLTRKPLTGYWF